MSRGAMAWATIALFAAALPALQSPSSAVSFTSAHAVRHVEATVPQPRITAGGEALRDETVIPRSCDSSGAPVGSPHLRGRHRIPVSVPQAPEHPLLTQDPTAVHEPAASGAAHFRPSIPPAGHIPAALPAFRC